MRPVTEAEIRGSFVNASKGDAKRADLPDLSAVAWDNLDYLGWVDAKREQLAYTTFVVDTGDGDEVRTMLLRRAPAPRERRKLMCSWCQDITATDNVTLFVAPRAGASGRMGNTVGTSICTDFSCSKNSRRVPTSMELQDQADRAWWRQQRVDGLRERSRKFLDVVMETA
ncbi:FBP domain-containing protein [Knoellia koreensis]|uniref:FBP domain-containing protein n=1 Tax=Knoellia koreensis TaxID=2730921 RepID=A0A849HK02_9MICO|nr:FBP domain-containing protein [Knoellia sp. DB2414S]